MENVLNLANCYAEGKATEIIDKAIAEAFAEGYKQGYQDSEKEIPVNLSDNKTEYVDLGLPSGTLWSKDYEKDGDTYRELTFAEAKSFKLPTKEQWQELISVCKVKCYGKNGAFDCIEVLGPNGNKILFNATGYKAFRDSTDNYSCCLWIIDENDNELSTDKSMLKISGHPKNQGNSSFEFIQYISDAFTGYRLHVRTVK